VTKNNERLVKLNYSVQNVLGNWRADYKSPVQLVNEVGGKKLAVASMVILPSWNFLTENDRVNNETADGKRIACQGCRHYKITWEPRNPYGCGAHGFKTNRNPALAVFQSSGIPCQLYSPKNSRISTTELPP